MRSSLLSVNKLQKDFLSPMGKKIQLLKEVTFEVQKGEIHAFLGVNGAGKTTTINAILGIGTMTSGQILFDGKSVNKENLKKIGYAPDSTGYYPLFTGLEHCLLMGKLYGYTSQANAKEADEVLRKVGLEFAKDKRVHTYSRGMKQRLGIALSLIGNPDLYIRDEPMNGLDPLGRILIKKLMKNLQQSGKSILFSTHILSDVEEVADQFSVLHDGHIVFQGAAQAYQGNLEDAFLKHVGTLSSVR